MHRKVSQDALTSKKILEIGAGNLNHLQWEAKSQQYDVVEPFKELYQNSPQLNQVNHVYDSIYDIPSDQQYDRIISVAVLEHICDLPRLVATAGLHLAPGGSFRAGIPNEGTILWTLGWKLTTGIEFRLRYNLDYGVIMRHEHVNTCNEIDKVLKYFFSETEVSYFGINRRLSLYHAYSCRSPNLERCRQFRGSSSS